MRIRAYCVSVLVAGLLAGAGLCVAQAQQAEPPKKPAPAEAQAKEDATPAVVPTGALRRGTQMQEAASEELVKWARGHAKRVILDRAAPPEDEAVAKAVDTRYPKAPAHAREAGVFLVWYLAYTEGSENQGSIAARVAELDRQLADLQHQLNLLGQSPRRLNPGRGIDTEEARLQQRVEELTRQRDFHQRQQDAMNARVDICLKRLAVLDENLKGRDPAEIRRLK